MGQIVSFSHIDSRKWDQIFGEKTSEERTRERKQFMEKQRSEKGDRRKKVSLYPLYSTAMGVHHTQIKEASELAAKLGVPTEFNKEGDAIFTSPGHRKRYCEAHGFYDRNGGYSDPQRGAYERKYQGR